MSDSATTAVIVVAHLRRALLNLNMVPPGLNAMLEILFDVREQRDPELDVAGSNSGRG